jgi:hypothetical protein
MNLPFPLTYVLFSSGHDANSRSPSVSGPMQDPGPIHVINVTQTAHGRQGVDSQSPDEYDEDEDEDEDKSESGHKILSQTPGQVGHQAKGKVTHQDVSSAGGKKPMRTCWGIPNKVNIDFRIDIEDVIQTLRPGQLLTANEVYSAPEWHRFERNHPKCKVCVCFNTDEMSF